MKIAIASKNGYQATLTARLQCENAFLWKNVTVEGGEDDQKVTKTENNSMIFDCTYRA